MTWTAPKTWATAEVVTAAMLNTHVRDNLLAIGEHEYARSTANVDTASDASVNDDTELFVPLAINGVYLWNAVVPFSSPTTALLRWTWTVPAGATGEWNSVSLGHNYDSTQRAYAFEETTATVNASTKNLFMSGIVVMSSTAGNLLLRWAQSVSNATATRRGSGGWVVARRIA